jgi:hypothetical protein
VILRTNLATRPFYNTRAVRALVGLLGIVVLAVTVVNVVQFIRLSAAERTLGGRADQAEAEAAKLRGDAARIRAQIDPKELGIVAAEAREANAIIDRRAFSWTELFSQFEQTLPPDVRVTAVQPRLERTGAFIVAMTVEARRVEDLDAFLDALGKHGTFRNVRSLEEQTNDRGLIDAVIEGVYVPKGGAAPAADENTGDGR